jgi:hypothetical protein
LADDAVDSSIASSRRLFATPGARLALKFFPGVFSSGQHAVLDSLVLKDNALQISPELSAAWKAWADEMLSEASGLDAGEIGGQAPGTTGDTA